MTDVKKIIIPKEGVSDSSYKVVDIYVKNGEAVKKGTMLGSYESSKAVFDIDSENEGYIFTTFKIGDLIEVGDTFFIINSENVYPSELELKSKPQNLTPVSDAQLQISAKALQLLRENNIDPLLLKRDLIREKDVMDYIERSAKIRPVIDSDFSFRENDVVIYGNGGHAKMCADIVLQSKDYNIGGIIDDNPQSEGLRDYALFGDSKSLDELYERGLKNIIIGIGFLNDLKKREKIYKQISLKFNIPTIIHPKALIEPSVKIGDGNQVMSGAIIGSDAVTGSNCIINSGAIISHDCIIGNSTHITPGAVLAGHVKTGERCLIGMSVNIFIGAEIGDDVTINNGLSIFKHIPSNAIIKD